MTTYSEFTRRHFALLTAFLPTAGYTESSGPERMKQFVRDFKLAYEYQLVALDMEDVAAVLRGVRTPVLGVGVGWGTERTVDAARAAVLDAGSLGRHTLVLVACQGRLIEFKQALNAVRSRVESRSVVIYGALRDPDMPTDSARVTLFTG